MRPVIANPRLTAMVRCPPTFGVRPNFAGDDDERRIEQAALAQIGQERGVAAIEDRQQVLLQAIEVVVVRVPTAGAWRNLVPSFSSTSQKTVMNGTPASTNSRGDEQLIAFTFEPYFARNGLRLVGHIERRGRFGQSRAASSRAVAGRHFCTSATASTRRRASFKVSQQAVARSEPRRAVTSPLSVRAGASKWSGFSWLLST